MSNATDPAFPLPDETTSTSWASGLTKRELFAAMALQGLCSRDEGCGNPREAAEGAVRYADALLAELAK